MKHKKLLLLVGVICLVLVLAVSPFMVGCKPAAPPEKPIKIGSILDFTGPVSDLGPRFRDGVELALEEANYEVAGRTIELIIEDGASDITTSLDKLKKLVERDGVNICIGPLMGDAHLALAPYAAEHKILITSLFNGMYDCIPYGNWIIYPTTCYASTIPMGWYAYDVLGYRTMVTEGSDYAGGHAFVAGAVQGFEERGGKVIQQMWTPIGLADYGPYLSAMKEADCVCHFLCSEMEAARFEKAYLESGLEMPLLHLTHDGHHTPLFLKEHGERVVDIKGESSYVWTRDDPINNKFVAAFRAKTGRDPGAEDQNAYTVTNVVLAGLEATGGDDSFDKLWPAVLAVKMDTPQGPLYFTPEGVAVVNKYITETQKVDDEYKLVAIYVYHEFTDPRLQ